MTNDTSVVYRLFEREVPEIAAGIIQIRGIARRTGIRSKVAVFSGGDSEQIDCVGTCVGERGIRIKRIVDALGGERFDILRWNDSPEVLIANALQPADVEQVVLHPAEHRAVVFAKSVQFHLANGRDGMNRQLASELSGWQIQVEELP